MLLGRHLFRKMLVPNFTHLRFMKCFSCTLGLRLKNPSVRGVVQADSIFLRVPCNVAYDVPDKIARAQ